MLTKTTIATIALILICGTGLNRARADDQAAVEQAKTAADAWLKLVDEGNYQESWNQFATVVKPLVSEEKWAAEAAAVRKIVGPVISRKFESAKYTTNVPSAPDGQYVILRYDSSFANKKSTVEEVVPMLDKDGQWRVSGYHFVK